MRTYFCKHSCQASTGRLTDWLTVKLPRFKLVISGSIQVFFRRPAAVEHFTKSKNNHDRVYLLVKLKRAATFTRKWPCYGCFLLFYEIFHDSHLPISFLAGTFPKLYRILFFFWFSINQRYTRSRTLREAIVHWFCYCVLFSRVYGWYLH